MSSVFATELPSVPQPPTAPSTPSQPSAPTEPSQPRVPSMPSQPEASPNASSGTANKEQSTSHPEQSIKSQGPTPTQTLTPTEIPRQSEAPVANQTNSSGSTTSASKQTSTATTGQTNTAQATNGLTQTAKTGGNSSSLTVGNSTIKSGDANVSGTAITSVNTNKNALQVSETNIRGNHTGDIVLDFNATCIFGCGAPASTVVSNDGNGSTTTNTAVADQSAILTDSQNNHATVGNTLTLTADSGHNSADNNTGGASAITTGNANVSANSITTVNNAVDGKIVYGVVNIYGNLVGDIILPQSYIDAVSASQTEPIATTQNDAGSTNTATTTHNSSDTTTQSNNSGIDNTLTLQTTTGNNAESNNTNGNNTVTSGQSNVDTKVLNVANTNVDAGNIWLVIVNEAGKWIGKIIGGNGSNSASNGLTITPDANGNVTATNSAQGAGSTNTTTTNSTQSQATTQNNTGHVSNNLNLTANTGENSASDNTGGNSSITTGNATIIANIVNFVNNNIINKGKLIVTVVNVFGSWIGNFITPGQQKQTIPPTTSGSQASASPTLAPTTTPKNNSQSPIAILQTTTIHYAQPYRQNKYGYSYNQTQRTIRQFLTNVKTPSYSETPIPSSDEKNGLTINIAWLLAAFPIAGVVSLVKRFPLFV